MTRRVISSGYHPMEQKNDNFAALRHSARRFLRRRLQTTQLIKLRSVKAGRIVVERSIVW
ncbi:unnamed protein product [Spirodela intermedia]|uniref:Uncharacterized protein n=1 Tax=Spirodela intermedia TaxID=51605 RepID=A0A7I8LFC8_SPIIN|nr:unnamed protein product [Spirodela intermedia]